MNQHINPLDIDESEIFSRMPKSRINLADDLTDLDFIN